MAWINDRYKWSMFIMNRKALFAWKQKISSLGQRIVNNFFSIKRLFHFPVPGGMNDAYPEFTSYSLRDYGNRVVFIAFKAFDNQCTLHSP